MMKAVYLEKIRVNLIKHKDDIFNQFYFLESGELHYKHTEKQWSIVEIFEHVNIINYHYIKNISDALQKTKSSGKGTFRHTLPGNLLVKYIRPHKGKILFRFPALKKTDPLYLRKKGHVFVDHIVFKDLTDGIDKLIALIEDAENKEIEKIKVPALLPFLKISVGDAFAFVTAHLERHILQAKNILQHSPSEKH